MLKQLDNLLTELIKYLDLFYVALGRVGEYLLQFISRTFEGILRVLRRAISIIYRFLRDLVVYLVKISWRLFQLTLVPLCFVLLWGFGSELWRSGYWKLGIWLEAIAIVGLFLFVAAFLASLAKSIKESPPSTANENSTREKGATIQFAFLVMDFIALGLVLWISISWAHWFSNPILRIVQVVECSVLLVGLTQSNKTTESDMARLIREAAGPRPLRAGTETDWPISIKVVPVTLSQEARRPEAFGTVGLDVLVGSDGKVRSIKVTESVPLIDEDVKAAVNQWEYKPLVLAGQSVPAIIPVHYTWAGDSVPREVLAQLTGTGALKSTSVFAGTFKNPSAWTIGRVSFVLRGPEDKQLPVQWERECDIIVITWPGGNNEFWCEVQPVDNASDWRWQMKAAWGLPSN